jgi:dTDP-glucose pyrophosphorylase
MKGVILPGGTGSRLFPLAEGTDAHLPPVGGESGVDDIPYSRAAGTGRA